MLCWLTESAVDGYTGSCRRAFGTCGSVPIFALFCVPSISTSSPNEWLHSGFINSVAFDRELNLAKLFQIHIEIDNFWRFQETFSPEIYRYRPGVGRVQSRMQISWFLEARGLNELTTSAPALSLYLLRFCLDTVGIHKWGLPDLTHRAQGLVSSQPFFCCLHGPQTAGGLLSLSEPCDGFSSSVLILFLEFG